MQHDFDIVLREMTVTTSPVVMLERVGQCFGTQVALESVTICIRPGELVAIIGRSGAGKTTLLRCLSRAIVPTAGAIRMGGMDLRPLKGAGLRIHRARVGVIYQQFNLVKRLRVLDNVLVGRLPHLRAAGDATRPSSARSTGRSARRPCAASTTWAPGACLAAHGHPVGGRAAAGGSATSRWRASTP